MDIKRVTVCLIATRKYHVFVQPLIDSIKKYFLLNHIIHIELFADDFSVPYIGDERVTIIKNKIDSYGFPEATLFRYRIMTSKRYGPVWSSEWPQYIYYFDVDYLLVSEVKEEIFGNIVAVLHPGFSKVGGGSWCDNISSNAYTFRQYRKHYFAGGTQGGEFFEYMAMMKRLSRDIDDDEARGVRAEWNDESHWNRALSEYNNFKILDSSYCMVEQESLRRAWKIDRIKPKIIALDKNHAEIRS